MKIRITGKSLAKAQLAGGVKKFNTTGQFGSLGNNGFGTLNNAFTNQFSSAATPTNNSFFGSNPKPLFNTSAAMNTMPNFNPDGTAPDVNDRWHDPNFVNYSMDQYRQKLTSQYAKPTTDQLLGTSPYATTPSTTPVKKTKGDKLKNASDVFNQGLGIASFASNMLDNHNRQQDFNSYMHESMMADNLYTPESGSRSGVRGDYDINNGMFRPNELGFKSKGQTTNAFYSPMNSMQFGGMPDALPGPVMDNYIAAPMISMSGATGLASEFPQPVAAPANANTYNPVTVSTSPSNVNITDDDIANLGSGAKARIAHNNPGNIHIEGGFAKKYGATKGRSDVGGHVAVFPDMQTGLQAMRDLLFGKKYINLPISQAREKWVGFPNESTSAIVKAMGADKKLADLSEDEKNKLFSQFVKWEDSTVYKTLKNKGLVYQDGGSINENNMKIRIVSGPQDNMKYGGQKGYGLDLGAKGTYGNMNQGDYDRIGNTLGPVDRDEANLEAERGETVLADVDNDGLQEHMKIGGKLHSEKDAYGNGGTPLSLPEGSFVFSNTKKMKIKDPEVLKHFNKAKYEKGGITPADIAKQYDINKYKAILDDPNSDTLSKKTAAMMIANFNKKLGTLALVQESMKGFPQGIPNIAKQAMGQQGAEAQAKYGGYIPVAAYGGNIPEYQLAGPVNQSQYDSSDPGGVKSLLNRISPNVVPYAPNNIQPWPGDKYQNKDNYSRYSAREWADKLRKIGYSGDYTNKNVQDWLYTQPESKAVIDKLHDKHPGIIYGTPAQGKFDYKLGYRWDEALDAVNTKKPPTGGGEDQFVYVCTGSHVVPMFQGKAEQSGMAYFNSEAEASANCGQTTDGGGGGNGGGGNEIPGKEIPDVPNIETTGSKIPYGWSQQDINDRLAAGYAASNVKKYHPWSAKVNPVLPDVVYDDWRAKAAARQSQFNSAANTLGTYAGGPGLASNLSFIAGQQAEGVAGDIDTTSRTNTNIFNNAEGQRAGIINQAQMINAQNATNNWSDENALDSKYRAAMNDAVKGYVKAQNQGITNAADRYNLNITESPYYYADPRTGVMKFNSAAAKAKFDALNNGTYKPQSNDLDNYNAHLQTAHEKFSWISDPKQRMDAVNNYMDQFKPTKTVQTATPGQLNKSRTQTTTYTPTSKKGGQVGYNPFNPYLGF